MVNANIVDISNQCSNIYSGASPASEPETKAVVSFLLSHKNDWKAYFSFHACIEMWLYPWAYTAHPTDDVQDLVRENYNISLSQHCTDVCEIFKYFRDYSSSCVDIVGCESVYLSIVPVIMRLLNLVILYHTFAI